METLKRFEEINQPDQRNLYYVRLDTGKRLTVEDRYSQIAAIRLNPAAPEDVRGYFATLQNLCLYAWFSYDFYALAVFLSFTLIEMALKLRLPIKGEDKRTLKPLLREAVKRELINEKAFTHIRRNRQQQAENLRLLRKLVKITRSSLPKNDYQAILLESLPNLRNAFAHPRGQAIHLPGEALFSLGFAAEFINQLFP